MIVLKTLLDRERHVKPYDRLKIALCFIIIFAILYYCIDLYNEQCFTYLGEIKDLTFIDCLYFSSTTQVTIGYGDILPNNTLAKSINFLQLMAMMYLIF